MNTLTTFPFKPDRRRPKSSPKYHKPSVCVVIVSNTRSGFVMRKEFKCWDDAHAYRDQRMVGGKMYRVEIKPL